MQVHLQSYLQLNLCLPGETGAGCGEELNMTEFSLHKIGARVLYNSRILVTTSLYLGAVCVELALLSWDLDHVHSYHSNALLTADFLLGAGQFFLYQVFAF